MAMLKEPADPRKDAQEIIYRAYSAIDALEQYNNALHKLEENFLSESAVRIITCGGRCGSHHLHGTASHDVTQGTD